MKRFSLSILSTAVIAVAAFAQHGGGVHSGGGGGGGSHFSGGGSHFGGGSSHFGGGSGGFHSYSRSSFGHSSFGQSRSYGGGSSFGHTYSRSTGQSSYSGGHSYSSTSHSPSSYGHSAPSSRSSASSSRSFAPSAQTSQGYSAGGHHYGGQFNNVHADNGRGGFNGYGGNGGFGHHGSNGFGGEGRVGHFFGNEGGFWGGGFRSGYWGYLGWGAPAWFFGAYLFDPWAEPCVISPWYYYPSLPPYIPNDDVYFDDPGPVNWQVDNNYDYAPAIQHTPLDDAIGDIVGAFNGENVNSINDLIPPDGKVAIYNDSKYMYSLSGKDFQQMMMDNLHDVKTIAFNTTMVHESGNQAIVKCKHVFSDPQGGQDIIYQMYRLQNEGGHYAITAFMTSQSQIHQDYF